MSFREWKAWVQSLPWSLRWFVYLVLLRPVLDTLYFLKEVSPALSPLYIIGAGTPVAIVCALAFGRFRLKNPTFIDSIFLLWGILVCFSALLMVIEDSRLEAIGNTIKHWSPLFVYVFARHLINNKRDLYGLLTTFLYGSIFPFGMLLYENLVSPIGGIVETRGFERYEGLYADVLSYAIYVSGSFLIACFFFIDNDSGRSVGKRGAGLFIIGGLTLLGLLSMHHTASWGVFAVLVVLLVHHSLGTRQAGVTMIVVLAIVSGALVAGKAISERLSASVESEVEVVEGEKETDQAFHGRMTRWELYYNYWKQVTPLERVFGTNMNSMDGIGGVMQNMHNDYLRIMFTTGILGLIVYLIFFAVLSARSFALPVSESFLLRGSIAIMLLYSVTTVPSLYAPLLYLLYPVFAYAAGKDVGRGRRHLVRTRQPSLAPLRPRRTVGLTPELEAQH